MLLSMADQIARANLGAYRRGDCTRIEAEKAIQEVYATPDLHASPAIRAHRVAHYMERLVTDPFDAVTRYL